MRVRLILIIRNGVSSQAKDDLIFNGSAVAEDLSPAYLGPRDMNRAFRVYESLVLRVKHPSAIAVIRVAD